MSFLRQSTAASRKIGPFLDETDGSTVLTGLTINQAISKLSKNGGTLTQKSAAGNAAHDADGYYTIALSTTDTNTLGHLELTIHASGALPVRREFTVIPANVFDSLIAGAARLIVAEGKRY